MGPNLRRPHRLLLRSHLAAPGGGLAPGNHLVSPNGRGRVLGRLDSPRRRRKVMAVYSHVTYSLELHKVLPEVNTSFFLFYTVVDDLKIK